MFDETKHILLHGSADNAIVMFTAVAQMIKSSAFCLHRRSKTLTPLVNCIVNDALVHDVVPNVEQTLLQFVNAVQLRLMYSLDVTPYIVIDGLRPQIWRNESGCWLLKKSHSVACPVCSLVERWKNRLTRHTSRATAAATWACRGNSQPPLIFTPDRQRWCLWGQASDADGHHNRSTKRRPGSQLFASLNF